MHLVITLSICEMSLLSWLNFYMWWIFPGLEHSMLLTRHLFSTSIDLLFSLQKRDMVHSFKRLKIQKSININPLNCFSSYFWMNFISTLISSYILPSFQYSSINSCNGACALSNNDGCHENWSQVSLKWCWLHPYKWLPTPWSRVCSDMHRNQHDRTPNSAARHWNPTVLNINYL